MDRNFVRNDEGYSMAECVSRESIMSGVGKLQELLWVWDIRLSLSLSLSLSLLVCFLFFVFLCDFWFSTVKWLSCFFSLHLFLALWFLLLFFSSSSSSSSFFSSFLFEFVFGATTYVYVFVALVFQTCFLDYLLPIQILSCKQGSSSTSSLTPFTSTKLKLSTQ